ncbi:type II toxin-antitoxin system ParD family antitoxin [Maricaulis virginensis]|uniref:Antitoxin ParD1 n=1 Tax=Maricaulis virginensis TaxID=144022 RepID=A0A9W6MMX1_9PROT|nr:type II toxin-antitoxin system ParD family antitoxin [Maricaulis virginensis]GLK51597.1 antitoxin ParD1 [Maricaulis virginensis]
MAKNTSFAVGEHFAEFIHEQVESGRYASASEVVRAGLRLLQVEEEKIRALRAAIDEGLASGRAEPFDFDEFLERKSREFRDGG